MPWLALPDIRKLHGKYAYETMEKTNDAGLANSAARLLPVATVCPEPVNKFETLAEA